MREAQQRIDSREFAEWQAIYQLEPWGRETQQLGKLAWMFHSVHRKSGGGKTHESDFIPGQHPPREIHQQSFENLTAMLMAAAKNG